MAAATPAPAPSGRSGDRYTRTIVSVLVVILVGITVLMLIVQFYNTVQGRTVIERQPAAQFTPLPPDASPEQLRAAAEQARQDAVQALENTRQALEDIDRTSATLDLLMNFLQGAAVLTGLALGATAYFGFRNLTQNNERFEQRMAEVDSQMNRVGERFEQRLSEVDRAMDETDRRFEQRESEVDDAADEIEERFEQRMAEVDRTLAEFSRLRELLPDFRSLSDKVETTLQNIPAIFSDLVQATQELRLKNYKEAYIAINRVLDKDPQNPQALYIAGWLELQYIPGKLEQGIGHLEKALRQDPDWTTAMAAYGVAVRRQALQLAGDARRDRLNQAEGILRQALGLNRDLIDLNFESFWGPLAGLLRDTGRIDEAIAAYEEARKTTPGSSYPMGNLANLYLQKARENPALQPKALHAFEETVDLARAELAVIPNDYFLMMDTAMSSTILGHKDPAVLDLAQEALEQALLMGEATVEMLRVSLRGWQNLRHNCPPEWTAVIAALDQAIARVEQTLAAKQSS